MYPPLLLLLLLLTCTCAQLILSPDPAPEQNKPRLPPLSGSGPLRIPSFEDVTEASGITQPGPSFKYGGPGVADVNNDGIYDLILSYHALDPMEIFLGMPNGMFKRANFTLQQDIHGVNVGHRTALSTDRIFSVNVGGGRGRNPKPPFIYEMNRQGVTEDITYKYGLGKRVGRPRISIFMDLSMKGKERRKREKGGPDMLNIQYLGVNENLQQFGYANIGGNYKPMRIKGFEDERWGRADVTDIDGDGVMELVSFVAFRIYKLVKPFTFIDATKQFLPPDFKKFHQATQSAITEFDMDNDGDFDLYVARAKSRLLTNRAEQSAGPGSDVLLKNVGGKYVDVSEEAGIPKGTDSIGVTAADFNNDGYVDLLVMLWREPDMLLLNQGDGTFKRVNRLVPKSRDTVGHNAVAVDYNLDGAVDLVVAHGNVKDITGKYFLMRNKLKPGPKSHYLLVWVGHAPDRGATSIHAVVTVEINGHMMTRRVGSRGGNYGGGSYIDTVHFGLGAATVVNRLTVKWTNGFVQVKRQVRADQKITLGRT